MDLAVVLVLGVLFILLLLAWRFFTWETPESLGKQGEESVEWTLSRLPVEKYKVVNNVLFRNGRRTVQVDHIVVSRYGIFVIETKNYSGWILGGENAEYWTKNMYGTKYRFYNPIRQNNGHIFALSRKLNLAESCFVSIVVFLEDADIKVRTSQNVIYRHELEKVICRHDKILLSKAQVEAVYALLRSFQGADQITLEVHVRNAQEAMEEKQKKLYQGLCPRCGRKLVLREGKYGKFYGCSSYPNCRFTMPY